MIVVIWHGGRQTGPLFRIFPISCRIFSRVFTEWVKSIQGGNAWIMREVSGEWAD